MLKIIFWIIAIVVTLFLLLRFVVIPSQSKLPNSIQTPTSEQENHTLSPCPDKPNCVSSTDTDEEQKIAPFSFEGSQEEAIKTLKTIVLSLPKSKVVTQTKNYLHAEFRSPLMAYVDDIEFYAEKTEKSEVTEEITGLIQVRSAARLGYSDLDKNKERVELIRQKFQ